MPTLRVSSRLLPAKASAEYLRKEAKRFAKERGVNLVAAQKALAHEYGHRNWTELMTAAKAVLQPAQSPKSQGSPGALEIRDEEWSTIITLAEASLSEMPLVAPIAPGVREWLENRKAFPEWGGVQRQFVATLAGRIVGYACAEHPPLWMRDRKDIAGEYRLFVVVEPSARRTLGSRLLESLCEAITSLGARRAWFQEYEDDRGLISFLEEKGFIRAASFRVSETGERIVRLSMDAPFHLLRHRDEEGPR
jgi:GNAT superfamily N-acetyltransferase